MSATTRLKALASERHNIWFGAEAAKQMSLVFKALGIKPKTSEDENEIAKIPSGYIAYDPEEGLVFRGKAADVIAWITKKVPSAKCEVLKGTLKGDIEVKHDLW